MALQHWTQLIEHGSRIYIGSNAGVPTKLTEELVAYAPKCHDVEIVHILTHGENEWAKAEYADNFKVNSLFIGGKNVREAIREGRADYTPVFLSEVSKLFRTNLPLDIALIMVSPPDEQGYCSCGVSIDVTHSAARYARYTVAQVNPNMPCTYGNSFIHVDEIDFMVEAATPIHEVPRPESDQVTRQIGQYISLLIEDGACLQMGIGKIPDAVLSYLGDRKNLGVHTEMFSDGMMELMKRGVINNRLKSVHPGKVVSSFCMGTRELYDFIDHNPHISFHPSSYVNRPSVIANNANVISINSALEIDLSGQIAADSIGFDFYSGIGGQMDFVTGARMSEGGKSIIAFPSTAKGGEVSRIKSVLTQGAGVVTSRGHVDYVVTEYGIAALDGKTVRERALELIRIAHPKFRQQLLEEVRQHFWVPDYVEQSPTEVPELGELQQVKVTLKRGNYILRPLNPSDERRLQEFFYSHTEDTLRMRYSHDPKYMSRQKSSALVSVNQQEDLALCIIEDKPKDAEIVAVGRYYLLPNRSAEVGFVTHEKMRGQGMATILLTQTIEIARKRGLESIYAVTRSDNKPMLEVFEENGFKVTGTYREEKELSLKL
ncbi:MAG: GNAT family N-acetyltransferase [Oceanospirillaceae bacterium]|nr:GNAT family N-acetyltransferase [Oceanospirillaceae bacterium]